MVRGSQEFRFEMLFFAMLKPKKKFIVLKKKGEASAGRQVPGFKGGGRFTRKEKREREESRRDNKKRRIIKREKEKEGDG